MHRMTGVVTRFRFDDTRNSARRKLNVNFVNDKITNATPVCYGFHKKLFHSLVLIWK